MSERETLLGLYEMMFRIRRFEEESARAYAQGKIGGFLHLYIGQEAIAVGAVAALKPTDYVITTYRDHGLALARGMTSRAAMAELFGKDTGCVRGLGGSMHFFDKEHHFLGGHAIVGGHCALGAGFAFKQKYTGDGGVTVCFLGEGAVSIGGFHEAASLAGLWKLPIVFVVENNGYAMGTSIDRTLAQKDITAKAPGYGMIGDRFEAHDVTVVRERIGKAAEHARSGQGPVLIEAQTYRFRGHSMSDPGKYRTAQELEERKKKDPVRVARELLVKKKMKEEEIDAVDERIDAEIADAVKFADESEAAKESSIYEWVYAPAPWLEQHPPGRRR